MFIVSSQSLLLAFVALTAYLRSINAEPVVDLPTCWLDAPEGKELLFTKLARNVPPLTGWGKVPHSSLDLTIGSSAHITLVANKLRDGLRPGDVVTTYGRTMLDAANAYSALALDARYESGDVWSRRMR